MMGERPGSASVQYGDVRGEAAGDVSDQFSNGLQGAAQLLGFKGGGFVVGMSVYASQEGVSKEPGPVSVTLQVFQDGWGVDAVNKVLAETNGELVVKEFVLRDVDIHEVLRCFKRFKIGLFNKKIDADTVSVSETVYVEDEDADCDEDC